tara:strand:+ start:591 stop:824 length:234 start_codon:yes stop_codon:yes gene_type:complete
MKNTTTQKILKHILTTVKETGATPSIRDIQTAMKMASNNTVRAHLKKLRQDGHLSEKGGRIELGPRYAVTVHDMATK